ncbi:MAG: nitrate reductase [Thiocapsa sp.]|nr:nitrate reductase [Thiocapsa sp.]MCG6986475.1 nitrate reductase [Thiocapsa sp.]
MPRRRRLHLTLLCLLALGTGSVPRFGAAAPEQRGDEVDAVLAAAAADRHACLRCHAMTTLAYRNPEDGAIVDLSIDRRGLSHSVHGNLACIDCHRRSYRRYPHPERPAPEEFDCIGCHRDDGDDLARDWGHIDAEFQRSVHAVSDDPGAAGFSCHSCHDPHRFRTAEVGEPVTQIVRDHNAVCLSCHEGLIAPHRGSHGWLPNRDAHWEAVRCVDCHTPGALHASHEILAAEESARNCVGCHSTDRTLLARLYQFQSEEDIARRGLIAKAVFNEAYVIGMSRDPVLDRLSLIILGLVFLLLTAHGIGRYLAHRAHGRA